MGNKNRINILLFVKKAVLSFAKKLNFNEDICLVPHLCSVDLLKIENEGLLAM